MPTFLPRSSSDELLILDFLTGATTGRQPTTFPLRSLNAVEFELNVVHRTEKEVHHGTIGEPAGEWPFHR